ncbi:MAG: hypothetical protein Q4F79_13140 [Eubacteriales bacterium]|nr:hypothetical protein [Eubacteriales bacterium]
MTLQELSDFADLKEQLKRDEQMLLSFQEAACPGAQNLSGMPHSTGISDKIGDLAVEIADMRTSIEHLKVRIAEYESRVSEFIEDIEDDYIRMLFRLRFQRCLTWKQVAHVLGGGNTETGVKSACYRYLGST